MIDFNDFFRCMAWFMVGSALRPYCDRLADWIISKLKGRDSDE